MLTTSKMPNNVEDADDANDADDADDAKHSFQQYYPVLSNNNTNYYVIRTI
jgi:hypothetical protein